jgi:hypothetical protein
MSAQWLWFLVPVVIVLCGFLAVRGGRRQYKSDRSALAAESYAQGARDIEASLRAQLSNHVTVVAGNDYGTGESHSAADESGGVLGRVRDHGSVPVHASEAMIDGVLGEVGSGGTVGDAESVVHGAPFGLSDREVDRLLSTIRADRNEGVNDDGRVFLPFPDGGARVVQLRGGHPRTSGAESAGEMISEPWRFDEADDRFDGS